MNARNERKPGFDYVDKTEINSRQTTVVPLRRQSIQTQAINCSNLGVLPATLNSRKKLMKEKLELMKVGKGCPKVMTILLVINKLLRPLFPHFQFTKE